MSGFDLDIVARSHGWYDLPPFRYDETTRTLRFIALVNDAPVAITVRETPDGFKATPRTAAVRTIVTRVLDLERDLAPFHAMCAGAGGFDWIARRGAGRILRSPTLFEDAVKVLATTNCSWALTRVICRNMVEVFDRKGAFPTAAFLAGLPEARLRQELKLGYRAPSLSRFAARVAEGDLDLSAWEDPSRSADDVDEEIRGEHGFGPYAAQTLGRLLGRHDRLGLDSWSRKKASALHFGGRTVKDARVEKLYRAFGPYAGLAFWLDMTRDWHAGRERLWP